MSMFSRSSYGPAAAFLLATILAMASCADTPLAAGPQPPVPVAGRPSGLQQIEQLIGPAACGNTGECRVIGVGARACGGPEAYRAWSVTQTDARKLEHAVARDTALRKQEIEQSGMLSTCDIKPVPAVACVRTPESAEAGRCTLASPSRAGS